MPMVHPSLFDAVLDPADRLYQADVTRPQAESAASPPLPDLSPIDAAPLSEEERALCAWLDARQEARVELLTRTVELNSGSRNPAGIEAVLDLFGTRLGALGLEVEHHAAATPATGGTACCGPHRVFRRAGTSGAHVLLMGHVDTVFEPGCGFEAATIEGERLHGPGAADMKGGLVVMLSALEALDAHGALAGHGVTVVLNGDEEISSRGSRPLIEAAAREATLGLVFEPGREHPWGALTVARKGTGAFVMTVRGRAAHSGNRYIDGTSAVDELSRKIIAIHRLTDLRAGRTLNVGIVSTGPGAKRNKVADYAMAEFDMRVTDPADAVTVEAKVREIAARSLAGNPWTGEATTTELEGGLARPPMPCTDERAALYRRVAGLAAQLEAPVAAVSVGGGSDANLAAAQGLLVLDGLGPVGGGYHTHDEWMDLPSLGPRSQLTTLLLKRVWDGAIPLKA